MYGRSVDKWYLPLRWRVSVVPDNIKNKKSFQLPNSHFNPFNSVREDLFPYRSPFKIDLTSFCKLMITSYFIITLCLQKFFEDIALMLLTTTTTTPWLTMTSWRTDLVLSVILSNSSMQQMPLSLNTNAPLKWKSTNHKKRNNEVLPWVSNPFPLPPRSPMSKALT